MSETVTRFSSRCNQCSRNTVFSSQMRRHEPLLKDSRKYHCRREEIFGYLDSEETRQTLFFRVLFANKMFNENLYFCRLKNEKFIVLRNVIRSKQAISNPCNSWMILRKSLMMGQLKKGSNLVLKKKKSSKTLMKYVGPKTISGKTKLRLYVPIIKPTWFTRFGQWSETDKKKKLYRKTEGQKIKNIRE